MNHRNLLDLPDIIQLPNGNKAIATFSTAEYALRLQKLRQLMVHQQLDAVLLTSIHNIHYYSDFLYCAFGRPYGCLITQDKINTISANIDGGQPWRRSVSDANYIYTDWRQDNFFRCVQQLTKGLTGTIGIEFDHISVERLHKLQHALPNLRTSDCSGTIMQLRMIKSAEEIAHITKATAIADLGGAACVEAIAEQVPEHEVALHATQTMVREIAKQFPHSELMDTWTWFQSGINTDGAHNPVTTRKIQKGDILSLNCFPMIAGYYVALERTLFFDHVDATSLKIWQVNCAVHRAGLELLKPGVRCCDVAQTLNKIYAEHDLLHYRSFGYGHSFGVLSHYYGREAGLELREDIDTILQPNMVVSMEPMLRIPDGEKGAGGYREHDVLVITEQGNRNITGFAFGPEHNIITA